MSATRWSCAVRSAGTSPCAPATAARCCSTPGVGPGAACLMAMLRHRAANASTHARLLVSARSLEDVFYRDEPESLAAGAGLTVHHTIAPDPPSGWRGLVPPRRRGDAAHGESSNGREKLEHPRPGGRSRMRRVAPATHRVCWGCSAADRSRKVASSMRLGLEAGRALGAWGTASAGCARRRRPPHSGASSRELIGARR